VSKSKLPEDDGGRPEVDRHAAEIISVTLWPTAKPAASFPSAFPIPSTGLEAFSLGLDAGRRREDVYFTVFAAMESWSPAVGPFVASELLSQSISGWIAGTSTWFDTEGKGGDL
jgi:hypothetical protein